MEREWVVKTIGYRTIALHQHDKVWVESYLEKVQFLCCQCDEAHPNPAVLKLVDCDPRPNYKSYWEISNYFKKKELKIRPALCSNPEEWDNYGHNHKGSFDGSWQPIIIQNNTVCPNCIEIAPKEYQDLVIINDYKSFKTKIKKTNNEEIEVIIQLV